MQDRRLRGSGPRHSSCRYPAVLIVADQMPTIAAQVAELLLAETHLLHPIVAALVKESLPTLQASPSRVSRGK